MRWEPADHERGYSHGDAGPARTAASSSSRIAAAHLNGRHTVFGKVVAGLDVVDAIRQGDKRTGAITETE
jgi:peptidyl-prolyl cis-trans isomerase B (cyclophilin B)